MYCQACGSALTHQTKYCNRCGTQLAPAGEKSEEKTALEKRLNEYLDGLFWVSVFGLGFVIGGMVLLKKFNFTDLVVIAYVIVSSIIFLINFGLSFVRVLNMMKTLKKEEQTFLPGAETRELPPKRVESIPIASVIENTTRSLERK